MELTESIEILNKRLIEYFGIDTVSAFAMYKIVWSETELVRELSYYSETGMQLFTPIIIEKPKYKQWIQEKFVLEKLVAVPEMNIKEVGAKISYEPLYVFEDKYGNYLSPKWEACKFAIDCVHAAMGKESLNHYIDPENTTEKAMEAKMDRVQELESQIFGNETDITDSLRAKSGIVVPNNYSRESVSMLNEILNDKLPKIKEN